MVLAKVNIEKTNRERLQKEKMKEGTRMEMCYDGALVMPSSYAVMSEEEMTYVEGGDAKKLKNNLVGLWNRTQGIRIAFKTAGIQLATIKAAAQYTFAAAVTKFGPVVLKIAAVLPKVICAALIVGAAAAVTYLWNNRVFY